MVQEIGESREIWGWDVWRQAEAFANSMKNEVKPFYIVYAAKQDKPASEKAGRGVYRQTFKAYHGRPSIRGKDGKEKPALLGMLVWYVDNTQGIFQFIPELSTPPDVPIDSKLLSTKSEDSLPTVMAQGEKMGVLLS